MLNITIKKSKILKTFTVNKQNKEHYCIMFKKIITKLILSELICFSHSHQNRHRCFTISYNYLHCPPGRYR